MAPSDGSEEHSSPEEPCSSAKDQYTEASVAWEGPWAVAVAVRCDISVVEPLSETDRDDSCCPEAGRWPWSSCCRGHVD